MKHNGYRLSVVFLACVSMLGCAARPPQVPKAIDFPRTNQQRTDNLQQAESGTTQGTVIRQNLPSPPPLIEGNLRPNAPGVKPRETGVGDQGDIAVTIEQMPLPAFIQSVYGGILQVNYSVDSAVQARTELITFRSAQRLTAKRLMEVSESLLKSYGVAVQDLGGVIRIVPATSGAGIAPLVRRGRAAPGVPPSLRPIFHLIDTEAISAASAIQSIKAVMGDKISIVPGPTGGILLSGQPEDTNIALELIQVFDQPALRSFHSVRVIPRYWGADEFARRLSEVLRVQGYAVGAVATANDPILVTALPPINSVLIFANSKEVLSYVLDWTRELDQLSNVQSGNAFFTYAVKNADAVELAKALNDLIGTTVPSPTTAPASGSSSTGAAGTGAVSSARGRRVVVNSATNSLIFQGGSQEDYRQWLSLLVELDRPVKSAMIDVLVAEVALTDGQDLGFSWRLDQLGSGASAVRLNGTTYNAQLSGAGVAINALLGGNPLRQLAISALASNSDSRVVSNPRILMRNGESATINVGQEVPTVTSQAVTSNPTSSLTGGNNNIVPQTVQYRSTGVILRVRPVIHAGDRIDLEVSQEISSAEPTTTGVTSSPTIRKRSLETKLTVRDGSTILLGGLISEESASSNSGVPGVKDIPLLGDLFKRQEKSRTRTELVMLITPYIINDQTEAEGATDAFNASLGAWAEGVRDRVKARRANASAAAGQTIIQDISGGKTGLTPTESTPKQVSPTSAEKLLDLDPKTAPAQGIGIPPKSPPATSAPSPAPKPATRGMINLGPVAPMGASGAAGGSPASAGSTNGTSLGGAAASTIPSSSTPSALPVGREPAPATINGAPVPPGATRVTDPKLIEELMKSIGK
jgi:general secretion pathway protein D